MASAVPVVSILALLFPLLAVIPIAALQQPQALRPQWPVGQQYQRQAPKQQGPGLLNYDYLQLVLQNPRALNPKVGINSPFTIHGLWPSNVHGPAVEFCNPLNYAFDLRLSRTLRWKLARSWPDAYSYNRNAGFWKQEYVRHGSCTGLTPEAFLGQANYLYEKINLNDVLRQWQNAGQNAWRNGWRPQVWRTSIVESLVRTAIQQPLGTKVLLLCTGQEPKVLKEVVICYDKQATSIISCRRQQARSTLCGPKIYIP